MFYCLFIKLILYYYVLIRFIMKELIKIFDEYMEEIQKYIQKGNYYACTNVSVDLLTLSILADFKDGIFIWNSLKNTFLQLDLFFEQYEINEEERNRIKNNCKDNIEKLQKFYCENNNNSENIFKILVEFTVLPIQVEYKYQNTNKDDTIEKAPFD